MTEDRKQELIESEAIAAIKRTRGSVKLLLPHVMSRLNVFADNDGKLVVAGKAAEPIDDVLKAMRVDRHFQVAFSDAPVASDDDAFAHINKGHVVAKLSEARKRQAKREKGLTGAEKRRQRRERANTSFSGEGLDKLHGMKRLMEVRRRQAEQRNKESDQ